MGEVGSVRGRVIDAAGMGVAGLTVSLSGASENSGGFVIEGVDFGPGADSKNSAVTDTNGDYQIVDVAEGSYKINVPVTGALVGAVKDDFKRDFLPIN